MISLYDVFMKPLESRGIQRARMALIKQATGRVLEIGAGTGANVPFYHMDLVTELILTDQKRSKHIRLEHENVFFHEADATNLPFEDDSFDTVVHTLVFCSVDDVKKGLQEIKRVLKPDGKLLFIEHVLPHKHGWRRLFQTINPVWRLFSSGCSLTKNFAQSLTEESFTIVEQGHFMNTVFFYGIAENITPKTG